jgi:hypothetical protein
MLPVIDTSTWWGILATLFATLSWIGVATVGGFMLMALNAYVRNGHRIRRSDATLFG